MSSGAVPPPMADRPVFVYGTLADADRVDAVLRDWRFAGRAVLEGLHRVDGRYPTLAPGGAADGRLLETAELDALDDYEGVAAGLYVRVSVPVVGGGSAWCYVGDPGRLDASADWPGEGTLRDRVTTYLEAASVRVERFAYR